MFIATHEAFLVFWGGDVEEEMPVILAGIITQQDFNECLKRTK